MQSVSSRIWTRAAVSISYDDNHYTTGTSKCGVKRQMIKIDSNKNIEWYQNIEYHEYFSSFIQLPTF